MPALRTHNDEQITEAVRKSSSIREVLGRLGLAQAGGNYKEFRKHIERLGLDITHFRGKGHGKAPYVSRPLSEILVEQSTYTNNNALRLRLLRAGMIEAVCAECRLTDWRGQAITLHLDIWTTSTALTPTTE